MDCENKVGCDADELTPNVIQAAGYKCLQVILQPNLLLDLYTECSQVLMTD